MGVDLVCWEFGDTLTDERLVRRPRDGVPEWTEADFAVGNERPTWVELPEMGS